jgi:quinol monooxygenase YgiN
MSKLNHTVMFKLHDNVSDEQRTEAVERLTNLGAEPGVLSWIVKESTDTRKGRIIIEQAVFASEAAYQEFRTSPAHIEVGDLMKTIADWWVGDYLED